MLTNSIFDGPIKSLLSILCILIGILLRAHAKGRKSHNFRFGIPIGHFLSECGKHGSEGVKGAVRSSCIWALSSEGVKGAGHSSCVWALSGVDLCWIRLLLFHPYRSLHFDHLNNFSLSWCTHVSSCGVHVLGSSATVVCCIWNVTLLEIDCLNKKWKLHFYWSGVIASSGLEFSSWSFWMYV